METIFVITSVIQSMGVSLGVGCSTVAILSYLRKRPDFLHKETSGYHIKFVYFLLRVAMGIILISTLVLAFIISNELGLKYLTTYELAIWTYITILFANAFLMTKHLMPRAIGPGLQGATWYALGITVALPSVVTLSMSYVELLAWYLAFSGAIILGIVAYLHHKES